MKKFPRFVSWLPYNISIFIVAKTEMRDANNILHGIQKNSNHCSLLNKAVANRKYKKLSMCAAEKDKMRDYTIAAPKITAYKVSIPMPLGERKLYTSSAIMELDGSIILRKY